MVSINKNITRDLEGVLLLADCHYCSDKIALYLSDAEPFH